MQALEFLLWGPTGAAGRQVDGLPVPADEAWLIQTCGIATNDSRPFEYRMQLVRNGHYHPLHCNAGPTGSTPVLAVTRPFVMAPGDYLKSRVNAGEDYAGMALLYSGWSFPVADLPKLLGVATGPGVDVSAFLAQCQTAAAALAAIEAPIG